MALILSLETSARECSVALHRNGELLDARLITEGQAHASKLAVLIDDIFTNTKVSKAELKAVAVSAGPGSYTGLRIGTSTAKGICFALKIPLISVPTLDLLTFQFLKTEKDRDGLLCPMIDAKRMEVYCQVSDSQRQIVWPLDSRIIDQATFAELLSQHPVFFFGDGALKCKSVIDNSNAIFISDILPNAADLGLMAAVKYQDGAFEDLISFAPLYFKDFVAKKANPVF